MSDTADRLYERVLVVRCQAGDETAFAEIVERYSPRLRYYLQKMLGKIDCAEDILQDVWFDVFRGVSRLAAIEAFRAWVYRIARDRALRKMRKRRPPARRLDEDALIDKGRAAANSSAEDAECIQAALDKLAQEHREVLILRFSDDMTYEDIARVTGCPVGTVRSRIHYAKGALRRALERTVCHDRE